ncbi:RadC family protein [Paludibacterium paludis]|uniref:UPF0758 protein n=1 Tax=Paludibacterium paludis TaxID=1225769 RepID=A0A918P622_9NEIS|nr:DNA repair protein RadC [Paludibacterium paludis]GGY24180.1 UPF0758 protein [Paludibacterium paludis]
MTINDWPVGERPREKLLLSGPQSLSDAELLAIFLRTGRRGVTAVDMARGLIREFGSLSALFRAPAVRLESLPGMGRAKAAQLVASRELAARALAERLRQDSALEDPEAVRDFLRLAIGPKDREVFLVLCLSAQNRVLAVEEVFKGTLTRTPVYPREIAKLGLLHNASSVIVAHNHPSGVATPSNDDIHLTRVLKSALKLVDIELLDHFIVTQGGCTSLAEHGWL